LAKEGEKGGKKKAMGRQQKGWLLGKRREKRGVSTGGRERRDQGCPDRKENKRQNLETVQISGSDWGRGGGGGEKKTATENIAALTAAGEGP